MVKVVGIALNKVNDMVSPKELQSNDVADRTNLNDRPSTFFFCWGPSVRWQEGGCHHRVTKQVAVIILAGYIYIFKMRLVTVTGKNERSAPRTFTQLSALCRLCAANASFFSTTI